MSTNNSKNRVGMSILEAFSMPSRTPLATTKWVNMMKHTPHRVGFQGLEAKEAK